MINYFYASLTSRVHKKQSISQQQTMIDKVGENVIFDEKLYFFTKNQIFGCIRRFVLGSPAIYHFHHPVPVR
jgi:hypothetical protein